MSMGVQCEWELLCQAACPSVPGPDSPHILLLPAPTLPYRVPYPTLCSSFSVLQNCEGDQLRQLVLSLCPTIWGNELVKAGLLLALMGGVRKGGLQRCCACYWGRKHDMRTPCLPCVQN